MNLGRVAMISYHTCPVAELGKGKAGGMNVYVRELSRQLGTMGIEVDIFTAAHHGHDKSTIAITQNVRVIHLETDPQDQSNDGMLAGLSIFFQNLLSFAESKGTKYDMVHSHYWLSGWIGQKAAGVWNAPHVVAFHTLAKVKGRARPGETDIPIRATIEKELLSTADSIVAASAHERDAMVQMYQAPEHKIEILLCGVDLAMFRPMDVSATRKRLGLNGEKILLFVGRIEPIKGLDLLIRSASQIESQDNLRVLVIGGESGQRTEMKRLEALAKDLGISDMLEFVGTVPHDNLPVYYNAADICVVPSYYESSCLVALEALACGTPVVAYRVGGLTNIVQHGLNGYLQFGRCPEPFANSLEAILACKGLRRSMSVAARKRAERMGWGKVATETIELYERITNPHRG